MKNSYLLSRSKGHIGPTIYHRNLFPAIHFNYSHLLSKQYWIFLEYKGKYFEETIKLSLAT